MWLDAHASVQFRREPFWFQIVRSEPAGVLDDWVWLHGYELMSRNGVAVAKRSVLVRTAALVAASIPAPRGET